MVGTAASGSTGKRQAPCPGLLLSARESLALHAAPGRAIGFVPAQEFLGIAGKVSGWFGHDHRGAPRLGGASIGEATDGCYSPGEEGGFPVLGIDRASPTDVAAWRKDKPFDLHGKTAGHGYRLGASACGIIDDRPGGRRACPGVMLKVPTRRPKHALPPPGLFTPFWRGVATSEHGGGIVGWDDASQAQAVTAELVRRGYTPAAIGKLWSGNFLRVWQAARAKGHSAR
jgi:hypothetical protein